MYFLSKWMYAFCLFVPGFLWAQEKSDSVRPIHVFLEVREAHGYEEVSYADVYIKQSDSVLAHGKTNFNGYIRLSATPMNSADSIQVVVMKSPFNPYTISISPATSNGISRKIFLVEEIFKPPPRSNDPLIPMYIKVETSLNRGFGFNISYGMFGLVDQGSFWDGFILGHGIGGCIGVEGTFNNQDFLLGPKLSAEYHMLGGFMGSKMSLWYVSDFSQGCWKFSPEFGVSLMGCAYLMAGYNFSLSEDTFTTLDGWRFSFGINFPIFVI